MGLGVVLHLLLYRRVGVNQPIRVIMVLAKQQNICVNLLLKKSDVLKLEYKDYKKNKRVLQLLFYKLSIV